MPKIRITVDGVVLSAELRDTPTANAILEALPLKSSSQTWGDEVYFEVPVSAPLEDDAKDVVEPGEIAFWTQGNCIAIGYGRTPISQGDEIRLAAPTNIWADAIEDVKQLKGVRAGASITIDEV